jgi:hypothetical protein
MANYGKVSHRVIMAADVCSKCQRPEQLDTRLRHVKAKVFNANVCIMRLHNGRNFAALLAFTFL